MEVYAESIEGDDAYVVDEVESEDDDVPIAGKIDKLAVDVSNGDVNLEIPIKDHVNAPPVVDKKVEIPIEDSVEVHHWLMKTFGFLLKIHF